MDIAIVGIAGRFPDANTLSDLCDNLKTGKDSVRKISKKRLKDTALDENKKYFVAGYLEDIDKFDYKLFGISKAEAEMMCPVQRQLLEVTYEIFESSGESIDFYNNSNTAIYVGANTSDYYEHADKFSPLLVSGNADEYIPAKIARFFNLTGNAQMINTACSSSLVAIHNACSELTLGFADYALVLGANIYTFPYSKIPYDEQDKTNLNSPDGKSKPFSKEANGMSYGEAVTGVLLKPLDKAIEDENIIYAVIKGTAVNNNAARSDSVIAVDSITQSQLLKQACENANISPLDLGYIEAHGAGTKLGDALEIEGLNLVFKAYSDKKNICPISTIKSNIGHTRMSAGICGLVRAVLSVRNKMIFPTANFSTPSDIINFDNSSVYVNKELSDWSVKNNQKRYAAITSLGASGINCSVIISEPPELVEIDEVDKTKEYLIAVSSQTEQGLQKNLEKIKDYILKENSKSIRDISYTLCTGRKHYDKRYAFCTNSKENAINKIDEYLKTDIHNGLFNKIIFVLTSHPNIDNETIQKYCYLYSTFRENWELCKKYCNVENNKNYRSFAFQYSFYKTLMKYGITTKDFLCDDLGEIVCDALTEKISLKDAIESAVKHDYGYTKYEKEDVEEFLENESIDGKIAIVFDYVSDLQTIMREVNTNKDKIVIFESEKMNSINDPILKVICGLYIAKYDINWNEYKKDYHGKHIELPFYEFEKTRCWLCDEPKKNNQDFSLLNQETMDDFIVKDASTELEKDIAKLWIDTLGIKQLSVNDDFFELGGDSLKTTVIIQKVNKRFNLKLSFEDIFDFPTVHLFSNYINKMLKIEDKIMYFWKKALKNENIKMEDNFFQLGGHSLLASQILISVKNEFNVELSFDDLFNNPTLSSFCNIVQEKIALYKEQDSNNLIKTIEKNDYYDVSPSQKRMFLLNEVNNKSTNYNVSGAFHLHGKLDKNKINNVFDELINRHESLRTIFLWVDGEIKQKILNHVDFEVEYACVTKEQVEKEKREFEKAFCLDKAPLMRVKLLKIDENNHILLTQFHHIIVDGMSISILMKEFSELYNGHQLEPLKIQYKDYAAWINEEIKEGKYNKQKEYWKNNFQGELPDLNLPTDFPRPATQQYRGSSIHLAIDETLTQKIYKLNQNTETTVYMFLLSVFNILLSKYSGQEDIIVGSPIWGRNYAGLDKIIGMFANTLAFRNYPNGEKDYLEFLLEVKANALNGYKNQDYPFDLLIDDLDLNRDFSRNPLFDVMFVLQNEGKRNEIKLNDLEITLLDGETTTSKFDLLLNAVEEDGKILLDLEYNTGLFCKNTIQTMLERFINLIKNIVEQPRCKIKELSMITEQEKNNVIDMCKGAMGVRTEKTIIEIFEEQVKKSPDDIAIYYKGCNYTYNQINAKANQLTHILKEYGVCEGDTVALYMNRSAEMIICLLAILKLNCTYLAIDNNYPKKRVEYMLGDSAAKLVLVNEENKNVKFETCKNIVEYNENELQLYDDSNVYYKRSADQILYLVYTSGTTGFPKAVIITNRNLVNLILHEYENTDINFATSVLQFNTISFDVCYQEIFTTLLCGGKLCIIEEDDKLDVYSLGNFIKSNNIEVCFLPTAYLKNIATNKEYINIICSNLKHIICAGEKMILTDELKECLMEKSFKIHNHYGPAETHVVTTYTVDYDNFSYIPPIGKPIRNNAVCVMDKYYNIQPVGIPGELCVIGDNVGNGYLNQEELTREHFSTERELGKYFLFTNRMYKTGDIARYLPDGNIEYLGRKDDQVKIRGYRIEIKEVENAILEYTGIEEVTVIAYDDRKNNKYLCAYYISNAEINRDDLTAYLQTKLPNYMLPSYLIQVDKFILTSNGKIDKKYLRELLEKQVKNKEIIVPQNETENKLLQIWKEILGLDKISVVDKFFDIGGNSLNALELVAGIKKKFNVNIGIRQIFEMPSIKEQAEYIQGRHELEDSKFVAASKKDYYPLSYAQKRMYILSQKKGIGTSYNMTSAIKITGNLDLEKTISCFNEILNRHEILRTCFVMVEGKIMQKIEENVQLALEYEIVNEKDVASRITSFIKEFDLDKAPLFRLKLMKINPNEHILVLDIHHIIFDGFSIKILIEEFKKLYLGESLDPVEFQYKDYSEWQNNQILTNSKQEKYWLDKYKTLPPVLDIPTDYPRPSIMKYEGASYSFEISSEVTERLHKMSKDNNTTMFMNLIAIYYVFLAKLTGQEDIVVGLPIAGREHSETQKIMGLFLNTLALRNQPESNKQFLKFLNEVRENAVKAYENEDYPFEMLLEKIGWKGDENRTPLFDTVFNVQDITLLNNEVSDKNEKIQFEVYDFERNRTNFDLIFFLYEYSDKIVFNCDYSTSLFNRETIEYFMKEYVHLIEEISMEPTKHISDFNLFSSDSFNERKNVISPTNEFNYFSNEERSFNIVELFEKQVERNEKNIAIILGQNKLTYNELNCSANIIARNILKHSTKGNVAILFEHGIQMIEAMLGVLKTGKTYIPMDNSYPITRLKYILKDSNATLIITNRNNMKLAKSLVENIDIPIICIEDMDYSVSKENVNVIIPQDSTAYIIYTSGSTGNPKGVMHSHKGTVNLVGSYINELHITENDKVGLFTSYSHAVAIIDIFASLFRGASILPYNLKEYENMENLTCWVKENKITIYHSVPQLFRSFTRRLDKNEIVESIRLVLLGGEAIYRTDMELFKEHCSKDSLLANLLGSSEVLVGTIFFLNQESCDYGYTVPVGYEIKGIKVHLVDKDDKEVLAYQPGEIVYESEFLAKGYWNNPDKTNEVFTKSSNGPGMLYRSGDIGRKLSSGAIEYLGRKDFQVKIRGYRVELGEVESCLYKHPDITVAAVIAKENENKEKYLCAYFTAKKQIPAEAIRQYLTDKLPSFMIPQHIIQLDEMPYTPNGKIDRQFLNNKNIIEKEIVTSQNDTEGKLADLCKNLLGIENVPLDSNFFDLGGHSLSAVDFVEQINKTFNVNITLRQIYELNSIRELADLLDKLMLENK